MYIHTYVRMFCIVTTGSIIACNLTARLFNCQWRQCTLYTWCSVLPKLRQDDGRGEVGCENIVVGTVWPYYPVSLYVCSLLRLFILGLAELKLPKDVQERKTFLALDDFAQSKEALLGFLQDFLLLPYGCVKSLCITSACHVRMYVCHAVSHEEMWLCVCVYTLHSILHSAETLWCDVLLNTFGYHMLLLMWSIPAPLPTISLGTFWTCLIPAPWTTILPPCWTTQNQGWSHQLDWASWQ